MLDEYKMDETLGIMSEYSRSFHGHKFTKPAVYEREGYVTEVWLIILVLYYLRNKYITKLDVMPNRDRKYCQTIMITFTWTNLGLSNLATSYSWKLFIFVIIFEWLACNSTKAKVAKCNKSLRGRNSANRWSRWSCSCKKINITR